MGQLGQTRDLFLGMQMGTIEMAKMPTSFGSEWIPELFIFDLPYLYNSRDEMLRVFRSPVGDKFLKEIFPRQNLIGIMWADDGDRSIYTHKPLREPEDLKGLKIRCVPSAIQIQTFNAMGGISSPMVYGEVYMALQQKVVDGAENSPLSFWDNKHWEVCKFYSMTQHSYLCSPLLASKKWWDSLPKDIRNQIGEAARETEKYFNEVYVVDGEKALGKLKGQGVQVISDVDKRAFEKNCQTVYDAFIKKYSFGKDLLDQVKAAIKKK
jgi:tripartite ATP-independent transporter DctP family solute receptor